MAFRYVGSAWRSALDSGFPPTDRFYFDPRQNYYPPQTDTTTYTAVSSGDNQAGEFNLTGGYASYLLDMPDEGTLSVRVKPTFNYNDASDQPLISWYVDADSYFTVLYQASDDKYTVKWRDGGTERTLQSAAYVDNPTLQVWTDVAVVWDISAGTGELYINGSSVDATWSGALDSKSTSFPIFEARAENGTAGAYQVNHLRFFNGTEAADADVSTDFRDVEEEEIFWLFDDVALGWSRVNITRFVLNMPSYHAEAEKPEDASIAANKLTLRLKSQSGEFADDQYAAWDPANAVYNGTSAQAYMQSRCWVYAEHWYSGDFEPYFHGRVDERMFRRRTTEGGKLSSVTIVCEDFAREMATATARKAKSWEDKKLSDGTDANSLVHLVTREASQRTVYNLASNSSFENATIANSWAVAGTGATFSRVAGGLFGSFQGDLVYGSAACTVTQTITFTDTRKLNVGETYTFSIYLKSSAACGDNLTIFEDDSVATNGNTTAAWSLSGGEGWQRFSVSHTITDTDSDRLRIVVNLNDNVTLSMDAAMLVYGGSAHNWFVLNDNDGASAVESADDADSSAYDQIGFDVDAVNITHPWAVLEEGSNPWKVAQEIADGTVASYMGIGKSGALRFRSPFKTGYSDPTPLLTLTDVKDILTEPDESTANTIRVEGVEIKKDTNIREIWNGTTAGDFTAGERWMWDSVNNGTYWPSRTDWPGGYWAKYADVVSTFTPSEYGFFGRKRAGRISYSIATHKDAEIIGASNQDFVYVVANAAIGSGGLSVTESVFDITSRADQAQIELYNDSGTNGFVVVASIRGKLVRRLKRNVHDSYVNEESVYREGEIAFEVGNTFVCTQAQVNQIADYWAKYFRTKKHEYTATFAGSRLYLEPGEWYTLDVGGVGERENINSTVRCLSVRVNRGADGIGETVAVFQEVEQNWTFDSNAITRAIASGWIGDLPDSDSIKVASSTYSGKAHSYCDGTADQTEIQNAINHVASLGGGVVQLTDGTYITTAALSLYSNVILQGVGHNTVIEKNANDYGIEVIGSAGSEVTGAGIRSLKVTRNSADTNANPLIYLDYADDSILFDVWISDSYNNGIQTTANCEKTQVISCRATDTRNIGMLINDPGYLLQSCIVEGGVSDAAANGISAQGSQGNIINCIARDVWNNGIAATGTGVLISSNQIYDCDQGGLRVSGTQVAVNNNLCKNNGNMIDRGNCENATSPMASGESTPYREPVGNEPTWARDSGQTYQGTYSYKFTFNSAGATDEYVWLVDNNTTTDMHGLLAGYQYTFSSWVYIPTTDGVALGELTLRFDEYKSGSWTTSASGTVSALDTWEKLSVVLDIDTVTTGIRFGVRVVSTASAGEQAYFDNMRVRPDGIHNEHTQNFDDSGTGTQLG
jgi:hypothetical protein